MPLICHATYIHDVEWFDRVMPLSYRIAWEMLVNSPDSPNYGKHRLEDFPGNAEFKRNQGLVNKGWCVVYTSSHRINVVYNHDGKYALYTCVNPLMFLNWIEGRATYGMKGDRLFEIAETIRLELGLPQGRKAS